MGHGTAFIFFQLQKTRAFQSWPILHFFTFSLQKGLNLALKFAITQDARDEFSFKLKGS